MAATEPPEKQDRGRSRKRRYFRRRRRKGGQDASLSAEQRTGSDDARPEQRTRPKGQNRRRNENRRRSSRRRGSAARARANRAQAAQEESQPQGEVYIYTHVIRPTYREGIGGEFQADQLAEPFRRYRCQPAGRHGVSSGKYRAAVGCVVWPVHRLRQPRTMEMGRQTGLTRTQASTTRPRRASLSFAQEAAQETGDESADESGEEGAADEDHSPRE